MRAAAPLTATVVFCRAVSASPTDSAGDDITGKRALGDQAPAQVADRGAVRPTTSASIRAIQSGNAGCRSHSPPTAASTRCSIAGKSRPIRRQRALVEDRPTGTFAARGARNPGSIGPVTGAAGRGVAREGAEVQGHRAAVVNGTPQTRVRSVRVAASRQSPTRGPVAHESARSQIHLSGLITDGPAVHLLVRPARLRRRGLRGVRSA